MHEFLKKVRYICMLSICHSENDYKSGLILILSKILIIIKRKWCTFSNLLNENHHETALNLSFSTIVSPPFECKKNEIKPIIFIFIIRYFSIVNKNSYSSFTLLLRRWKCEYRIEIRLLLRIGIPSIYETSYLCPSFIFKLEKCNYEVNL